MNQMDLEKFVEQSVDEIRDMAAVVHPFEFGMKGIGFSSNGGMTVLELRMATKERNYAEITKTARKQKWMACVLVAHMNADAAGNEHLMFYGEAPNCTPVFRLCVIDKMPDETLRVGKMNDKVAGLEVGFPPFFHSVRRPPKSATGIDQVSPRPGSTPSSALAPFIEPFWRDFQKAATHSGFFLGEVPRRDDDWESQLLQLLRAGNDVAVWTLQRFVEANASEKANDYFHRAILAYCTTPPPFDLAESENRVGMALLGGLFHCVGGGPIGPLLIDREQAEAAYEKFLPIPGMRVMAEGRFYTPIHFAGTGPASVFSYMNNMADVAHAETNELPQFNAEADDLHFEASQLVLLPYAFVVPEEHGELMLRPIRAPGVPLQDELRLEELSRALERAIVPVTRARVRLTPVEPLAPLIRIIEDIRRDVRSSRGYRQEAN